MTFSGLQQRCFLAVIGCLCGASGALASETLQLRAKLSPDGVVAQSKPLGDESINVDFPEPTDVRDLIKAYALWSNKNVIVQKDIDAKLTIHAPQRVSVSEGLAIMRHAFTDAGLVVREDAKTVRLSKATD